MTRKTVLLVSCFFLFFCLISLFFYFFTLKGKYYKIVYYILYDTDTYYITFNMIKDYKIYIYIYISTNIYIYIYKYIYIYIYIYIYPLDIIHPQLLLAFMTFKETLADRSFSYLMIFLRATQVEIVHIFILWKKYSRNSNPSANAFLRLFVPRSSNHKLSI